MSSRMERLLKRIDRAFARWDAIDDPTGLPFNEFKRENTLIDNAIAMEMMYVATRDHYTNIADEEHF